MACKDFKKRYKIEAEVEDIWAALTNPFTIELWSGYPAKMSTEAGTEFELWDGDISGINIAFEDKKQIVQQWYFGDQPEKSIVTIKLFQQKKIVEVLLEHTNIPEEDYDDICQGWNDYYFGAIKEFFEAE